MSQEDSQVIDKPNRVLEKYVDPNDQGTLIDDKGKDPMSTIDVVELRQHLQSFLKKSCKEGDIWYIIPTEYFRNVLSLPVESLEELKAKMGPVTSRNIVASDGSLYAEDNEPVGTYNVPPEIFNLLVEIFGLEGFPVARSVIVNPDTGVKEIEREPLKFWLHYLSRRPSHDKRFVRLSRTRTFGDLQKKIESDVIGLPQKTDFRMWIISSNSIDEYPILISSNTFIFDIPQRTAIHPGLKDSTLKSKGLINESFHLLIELRDRNSQKFPIEAFLSNSNNWDYLSLGQYPSGGQLGLQNLGNSCYMNSALQCLTHIPELSLYFLFNIFMNELNLDNPLGNHGNVAKSFGSLLKSLFENPSKSSSFSPREFKSTMGRYSSIFSGYLQQDSQEFLSWLLDALHEDLNRIKQKPYYEKPEIKDDEVDDIDAIKKLADTCWSQYKLRNDSVISDLFTGLYKSTLICPDCHKTSITFDPYNDLTLPLPISNKWYHTFTVVDFSKDSKLAKPIMNVEVELSKNSNYEDLIDYLSKFLAVPKSYIFLYELFRNFFYTDFQADRLRNKYLPIGDLIRKSDEIFVYIIPHDPKLDLVILVLSSVDDHDKSYQITELFGLPLFIVLNKEVDVNSFGRIRKKVEESQGLLTSLSLGNISIHKDGYSTRKDFQRSLNDSLVLVGKEENKNRNDYVDVTSSDMEDDKSDISLANADVSADAGFELRFFNDESILYRNGNRGNQGSKDAYTMQDDDSSFVRVPQHKPNLNSFKLLADELNESKRRYYHFARQMKETIEQKNNETDMNAEVDSVNGQSSNSSTEDGFILVNNDSDGESAPRESLHQSLSDEDIESEPHLTSLTDSSPMPPQPSYCESSKPSSDNSPVESPLVPKDEGNVPLIKDNTILLCKWSRDAYQEYFGQEETQLWSNIPSIPNRELDQSKELFEKQQSSTISLKDCLKNFSTPEVLGEHDLWYCPRCKAHKQATKTISLWSTGDILTIHLKRFHSARAFSDKIDMVVDFPVEGLDMSEFITEPNHGKVVYDLVAIDNHYGGLGGGHYTASVYNYGDKQWYYFNDSRVTKIEDPRECVSSAAYLLFYRKRTHREYLGGQKVEELLKAGRITAERVLEAKRRSLENLRQQNQLFNPDRSKDNQVSPQEENNIGVNVGTNFDHGDPESASVANLNIINDNCDSHIQTRSRLPSNNNEDNIRKQRLISKEKDNNKLIQIKSNGKEEVSSSPISNSGSSE